MKRRRRRRRKKRRGGKEEEEEVEEEEEEGWEESEGTEGESLQMEIKKSTLCMFKCKVSKENKLPT